MCLATPVAVREGESETPVQPMTPRVGGSLSTLPLDDRRRHLLRQLVTGPEKARQSPGRHLIAEGLDTFRGGPLVDELWGPGRGFVHEKKEVRLLQFFGFAILELSDGALVGLSSAGTKP